MMFLTASMGEIDAQQLLSAVWISCLINAGHQRDPVRATTKGAGRSSTQVAIYSFGDSFGVGDP